ncbi:hypothetical protein EU805_09075 [Salipiger sp. IMCC34102]|uniref:hypothetical protein n=1 Tax=Salipiger sp. IMCC34102 TaxID=2510647 RepID=UPI00101CA361|nr:hypothetical protein [Salipiger sp. IMCC34102]RYH02747.1 hypothetical protein EU805_09075 [Salipiger sp. IMCC34102]
MTNQLTRRAVLTALPVSGIALATPFPIQAQVLDPVVPLYHQWLAARAEWYELAKLPSNADFDDPRSLEAAAREDAAFNAAAELTPCSSDGMAALAHMVWESFGPTAIVNSPDYQRQCDFPDIKMIAALWRAASGKPGRPCAYS